MSTQILAAGIAMTPINPDGAGEFGGFNVSNVTHWVCNAAKTQLVIYFNDATSFSVAPVNVPVTLALLQQFQ